MNETTETSKPEKIVCTATKDLPVRLFVVAAMLVGFGIYCFIDSHIRKEYPYKPLAEDMNVWLSWAFNFYGSYVFAALGIIPLAWGFTLLRRKLIADGEGIGFEGKDKIAWADITNMDVSELADKQILHLEHSQGQKLKLDGYNMKNFKELVDFIEDHVTTNDVTTNDVSSNQ